MRNIHIKQLNYPSGEEKMQEIARAIQRGAKESLMLQYRAAEVVAVVVALPSSLPIL